MSNALKISRKILKEKDTFMRPRNGVHRDAKAVNTSEPQ